MKSYSYIILFCLLFTIICCKSKEQIHSEEIVGKVTNIDSTQSWYIINFEYKNNKKGVFISQKTKCKYPKKSKLIMLNHSYNFKLSRMIQNNYNEKKLVFEVEGKETWNSFSGIDYFEYSNNTCGLYTWK